MIMAIPAMAASGGGWTNCRQAQRLLTRIVAATQGFRFSLDGNHPKVTSGGWAKEATVHQFPISKGIAGVHMFLDPGASRELHWPAIAAEWAYVIDGRCQTVVLEPSGASGPSHSNRG
jgi:oxalate decarboxylase/phosphoglucose isomerase-like protein (cupin superfamily)